MHLPSSVIFSMDMRNCSLLAREGITSLQKGDSFHTEFDMYHSKHSGYEDLEWAIGLNRFALETVGLWPKPFQSPREKLFSNLRPIVTSFILVFSLVIPGYLSLIRIYDDMLLVIDNLQITLPVTMTVLKICIMWWKKEALLPVVNMIVSDWMSEKTDEHRNIMVKQAKRARGIIIFGYGLMVSSVAIFTIPPCFGVTMRYTTNVTDSGRPLPCQTYYPYDTTKSPFFEFTFIAQFCAVVLAAISYTGIDNFLGLSVLHVCAQMEHLAQGLMNVKRFKDFNAVLTIHVKHHIRLTRSVDAIDSTFNLMLLGLLMYFAILFCLQGFLMITVIGEGGSLSITRLSGLLSVIVNLVLHMTLYCVVGEILASHNEKIYHATYHNEWYLLPPKEARNLMLIMLRTDRPLYISAGKMFPLTMTMFCKLLKTSAGYMSVLVASQD